MTRLMLTLMIGLLAAACNGSGAGSDATAEKAAVTGTAMYRERIMLPPTAVFEATLEDISRQDVAATVLGKVRIDGPGPYEFSIPYDPVQIDERMSYSVRGRLSVDEQLMFTTDTNYPVLTRGAGNEVNLMLKRVANPTAADGGDAVTLENTYWALTHLGSEAIELTEHSQQPHLRLDATSSHAGGSGDCNRFSGGYALDGNTLTFGQLAMTMMACIEGMDVDNRLAAALSDTKTFTVEGRQLQLVDAGGTVVASFEVGEPAATE
jgi:putative lipoprotein